MSKETGRNLTRHEFDAIIRRAAELAASEPEAGESALSEAELFRIAREVGLSEQHVRRALAEVHAGLSGHGPLDRIFGPSLLEASRVVPGAPRPTAQKLDDFLAGTQLLEPVRRGVDILQYRPALDWVSKLARAASFASRKYFVASAKSVEVHLLEAAEEETTLVELVVDPGTRGDSVAGAAVGGGTAGVALGAAVAISLAGVMPVLLASGAGVALGAGVAYAIAYAVGARHKRKLREVQAEVEEILDRLEGGESLEPPPASWRRWVKRQFHGVAHDLMRVEDEINDMGGGRGRRR